MLSARALLFLQPWEVAIHFNELTGPDMLPEVVAGQVLAPWSAKIARQCMIEQDCFRSYRTLVYPRSGV